MKVLILPGYSIGNKEFNEQIWAGLEKDFKVETVEWRHWTDNKTKLEDEVGRVSDMVEGQTHIVAKSIGTWVAVQVAALKPQVKKMVLCGIPVNDLSESDKEAYKILGRLDPRSVLVLQNENDPHGTFTQVAEFMNAINSDIAVLSMPRSDHSYPYKDEARNFLV